MTPKGQGLGPADYWVVYYADLGTSAWWTRWLSRRLIHVEVWWLIGEDYWVAMRPNHCYVTCDVMYGEPRVGENGVSAVQQVSCLRSRATPMVPVGLKTCVSVTKAVLGVRAAWVITPRQLYRFLAKRKVLR